MLPVAGRIRLIGERIGSVIWNNTSIKTFVRPGEIHDRIARKKIQMVRISKITLRIPNISDTISLHRVPSTGYTRQ
jgi:hypothetical protein